MAAPVDRVWTIAALLQWTEQFFNEKNLDSPRLDAQILLAHALNCRRTDLYIRHDDIPVDSQRTRFRELVKQRAGGMPVAYLVGAKEFYLLPFEVTPDVLIPRPATETLVMTALELMKGQAEPRVLDIGTGSGCIAIAVATHKPDAKLHAVDLSDKAIAVARRNADRLGVAGQIRFLVSDLFSNVPAGEKFAFILTNPPYIPSADVSKLAADVREHEPIAALDGGENGFQVIDRILASAGSYLTSEGTMLIEIGYDQEKRCQEHAIAAGWVVEKVVSDMDRIPRVAVLRR